MIFVLSFATESGVVGVFDAVAGALLLAALAALAASASSFFEQPERMQATTAMTRKKRVWNGRMLENFWSQATWVYHVAQSNNAYGFGTQGS